MDTQTEETADDRNTRRTSIGGKTRRYSIGITSSQKSNQEEGNMNIRPNYLRASTGSCHDFCKYGKKHEQSKSASPVKFKRTTPVNKEKVTKTVVPVERKKTTMATKLIKPDVSLPSKKVEVSKRVLSKVTEKELKVSSSVKPKPIMANPDASTGSNGGIRKKDVGNVKKRVKNVVVNNTPTEAQSPKRSVSRVLSLKTRKQKPVSPLKDQNRMPRNDQIKEPVSDKVQIETLLTIGAESVPEAMEIIPSSETPLMEFIKAPVSDNSQSSDKEVLDLQSSIAPPVSESSQSCYDEEVSEEEFEYTDDDDELETSVENSNQDKIPRKGRMVISDGKDDEAIKLRFRRGKILDLQSDNNNGPRRLKFRKGRDMEDDKDGQRIARRSFMKKDVNQETNYSNSQNAPESVVLKHQGEQGKKDAQGLFNNVIEETASKLVESRKSKVKALVGAFETVISLQDGKPSSSC